jgi:hypothetical protein
MRITHTAKFRKLGSRSNLAVTSLAPKPGRRWQGRGLAFPRKSHRRLVCTLLACWEEGHEEPWFLVTDLAPEQAEALWYGMRAWIEQGFKLLKSGGWQWQATRMTDPERAERLWLVLAVATCFVLKVGGDAEANEPPAETSAAPDGALPKAGEAASGQRAARRPQGLTARSRAQRPLKKRASGTRMRPISVFMRGLSELLNRLFTHHRLPKPRWRVEPWLELGGAAQATRPEPAIPIPKSPSL